MAFSFGQYSQSINPSMLDAQGKFKAPSGGVNYRLEGLTPQQAWDTAHQLKPEIDGSGTGEWTQSQQQAFLNPAWVPGPDNGGGFLGGIGRGIGNLATGIAHNPALMAALTAGIGSALSPAVSAGATAGGTGIGGSAGIGSGTVLGGGAASVTPSVFSSVMTSPWAKPLMNAGKTLLSGGNWKDAALSGFGSYAGSTVGSQVGSMTNSPFVGSVANALTQSAIKNGSRVQPMGAQPSNPNQQAIVSALMQQRPPQKVFPQQQKELYGNQF
jgi:hypothetical protein